MSTIKPIRLALKDASIMDPPADPTLGERFLPLATAVNAAYRERFGGPIDGPFGGSNTQSAALGTSDPIALVAAVADFLVLSDQLDAEYGADATLPVEDASDAADEALRCATELDPWLDRFELPTFRPELYAVMLGIGLWAMRHDLPINSPEPIVNALAHRSNEANTKQETAAAYAMMQGFISHLAPLLEADLERSNPERPWRLLNLNFALTAIRTGDPALMRFAFDIFNTHLPDERAGFYEEACVVASQPGFPLDTRALIEAEHAKWTRLH